jgi:hypothetical protein
MKRALLVASTVVPLLVGCGGTSASQGDPASGDDAGGAFWQHTPNPDAQTFDAQIGPIPLSVGEERTVCITKRLTNSEAMYATAIGADLAPGSHHLILYRSPATTENLTPKDCSPFQGILDGEAPLMIVEKAHDELDLPDGVGLKLAPQQMVKIEAHYINTTGGALEGMGDMKIEAVPVASAGQMVESDLSFWGTHNITIPPNSSWSTGVKWQRGIPGAKAFAVTTHQHHFGSEFKVWYSPTPSDTSAPPIADTTDWANPPLYRLNPLVQFDDSSGLSYECDWKNTSSSTVKFGESALEEMCFLWVYYYPSQGFDICFDGLCLKRATDAGAP